MVWTRLQWLSEPGRPGCTRRRWTESVWTRGEYWHTAAPTCRARSAGLDVEAENSEVLDIATDVYEAEEKHLQPAAGKEMRVWKIECMSEVLPLGRPYISHLEVDRHAFNFMTLT